MTIERLTPDLKSVKFIDTPTPRIEKGRESSSKAWKVAQVALPILAFAALVYCAICDSNQESYCVIKDKTQIALNFQTLASLFY